MRVGAHLRQSGLLVADFVFADGRQLLQGVAVVGERSRQSRKLCPSYRTETENTRFTIGDRGQERRISSRFVIDLKDETWMLLIVQCFQVFSNRVQTTNSFTLVQNTTEQLVLRCWETGAPTALP